MELLLEEGILKSGSRNSEKYINSNGTPVGYYRTGGAAKKRYIEDKYKIMAETLLKERFGGIKHSR